MEAETGKIPRQTQKDACKRFGIISVEITRDDVPMWVAVSFRDDDLEKEAATDTGRIIQLTPEEYEYAQRLFERLVPHQ